MKLKKDTIVRFALDAILQFSKKRKRKMIVTYRGMSLLSPKIYGIFDCERIQRKSVFRGAYSTTSRAITAFRKTS
jgi:hypothetical protein